MVTKDFIPKLNRTTKNEASFVWNLPTGSTAKTAVHVEREGSIEED